MSDSEDDFVTYGNALEPIDEDNLPSRKPIAIEDQCVYDEQGRRRFHGAFTGGFSAGYFNTVGSRDGWRPQQFKSTRANKAGGVSQKPEDFMDDEDTAAHGFAPMAVRATKDYRDEKSSQSKRKRLNQNPDQPIPGTPVLDNFLQPVKERIGVRLLKKLGWKPGQGIGPRLTKQEKSRERKKRQINKIYGCALPPEFQKTVESQSESDYSDDEYSNLTFAPDDYEPFRCKPKDNFFGIGYTGLDRQSVLGGHINLFDNSTLRIEDKNKKKLSITGQAFGVGAFEAEDEDIYARDDMSNYDFIIEPEKRSKTRWNKSDAKAISQSRCIEGFVPAKNQLAVKKVFPAPALPKDFQPVHVERKSRFSPLSEEAASALENERRKNLARQEMSAVSRAKIINDERPTIIESTKSSDASKSDKSKSASAKLIENTLNLYGKEKVAEREKMEKELTEQRKKNTGMSWLDKLSSTAFVRGEVLGGGKESAKTAEGLQTHDEISEKPLVKKPKIVFGDLDKQRRFEQYLKFSESERKLKFPGIQPLSMTDWERDQEIIEFEKAAKISYNIKKEENSDEEQEEGIKIDLSTLTGDEKAVAAAKMKMFGSLTRKTEPWKPAKLVCVRFNIAEPNTGCEDPAQKKKEKKKLSIFDSASWNEIAKFEKPVYLSEDSNFNNFPSSSFDVRTEKTVSSVADSIFSSNPQSGSSSIFSKPLSEKEKVFQNNYEKIFGKDAENEKSLDLDTPTSDKTLIANTEEKRDLFKAIFLSSDEENEEEKNPTLNEEKVKAALIGKASLKNIERNTSPPRGIFANVDLDSLLKPLETSKPLEASNAKDSIENPTANQPSSNFTGTPKENPICKVLKTNEIETQQEFKPVFRKASKRHKDTSSDSDTNSDSEDNHKKSRAKSKKSKKEKKKHKHKSKKHKKHKKKEKR